MIEVHWNPVWHLGPIPVNWYGLGWAAAFIAGAALVRRWASRASVPWDSLEDLLLWTLGGTLVGARLYFILQNDPLAYAREPWRMLAVWEGGLAFFGGLFGAIGAAWLYTRRGRLPFNTNGRPVRARRADRGQGGQGTAPARAWRGQGEDLVVGGGLSDQILQSWRGT